MGLSRRSFLQLTAGATASAQLPAWAAPSSSGRLRTPGYSQVRILGGIAKQQVDNAQAVLATLDDDALLKPFRIMGGQPAPGRDIGGWYGYLPDYNWHTGDAGLAPGHCFGQWASAMARFAAAGNDSEACTRVLRLHQRFAAAITPDFFDTTRYPAYTLDKLNIGLLDAHTLLRSADALAIADKARQCALLSLPPSALERDIVWRGERDFSYTWDESYTLPENLYLLHQAGAGSVYLEMARKYLMDSFFAPLARSQNILGNLHGYSHVNALGSAMQAFFNDGNPMYLDVARNGITMVEAQSYATGGWAPDELFEKPGSGKLLASLTGTHNSFETPCGTYAMLKLSRYLLQATRDGHYGDLMERVIFNSMFGALPLQPDGRTFYYADLNGDAKRVYSAHRWPCCAGTYTQVAADYGINSYLLDPDPNAGLWVNLYLPSTVRWQAGTSNLSLTQSGEYPLEDRVHFSLEADRPCSFALRLRIPAWCTSPSISVNGQRQTIERRLGFATVRRSWRDGDSIELSLPATLRWEAFPSGGGQGPALAALCHGSLVLLPDHAASLRRDALSRIQRAGDTEWLLKDAEEPLSFKPFFAVGDAPYATYLHLV